MAVKVECNKNAKKYKYPVLKEDSGVVVLFTEKDVGTVLYDSTPLWGIGYYGDAWDESCFTLFEGEITLFNKEG